MIDFLNNTLQCSNIKFSGDEITSFNDIKVHSFQNKRLKIVFID